MALRHDQPLTPPAVVVAGADCARGLSCLSVQVMERVEPPIDEKKPGEPDVWIGEEAPEPVLG